MSEELETDSNSCEVLDSSVKGIVIGVCENENDASSSKTSEPDTGKRRATQETDLQHQTLPVRMDANGKSLTADFEHAEADSSSDNFIMKDASVGEASKSSIVERSSTSLVDDSTSSSHPLNLPHHVIDSTTAVSSLQRDDGDVVNEDLMSVSVSSSEQCNGDVGQLQSLVSTIREQQQHTSGGCVKSSNVIQSMETAESGGADKPSTVVIISARRDKDSSTPCQADLNCASSEVNENAVDGIPQSMADLYMCCSDGDTTSATEFTSDSQSYKHTENTDFPCAGSQNETERISGGTSTRKRVIPDKQWTTANGTAFLQ